MYLFLQKPTTQISSPVDQHSSEGRWCDSEEMALDEDDVKTHKALSEGNLVRNDL